MIPPEAVAQAKAEAQRKEDFEVWPEHRDAVQILIACHNQWSAILADRGLYYLGLDLCKAGEAAIWLGVKKSPALLWQLRILEDEAKKLRNSRLN